MTIEQGVAVSLLAVVVLVVLWNIRGTRSRHDSSAPGHDWGGGEGSD